MRFCIGLGEGERRAMADILIEGSEDGPLKTRVSFLPVRIAGRHSAPDGRSRRGFWVPSYLRVEIHLDSLARGILWGVDYVPFRFGPSTVSPILPPTFLARSQGVALSPNSGDACSGVAIVPDAENPCSRRSAVDHFLMGVAQAQVHQIFFPR